MITSRGPRPRRIADLATHEEAYVTPQALAEYLTVSRKMVMKWIEAGVLPAYRFGRHWRVRTCEAAVFVESQRVRPLAS